MDQRGQRRDELQSRLIERATRDQGFREELMRDPRGVIGREMGIDVPEGVEIKVVEESPTTSYLVLPPAPASPGQELSDRELEAVAGGWSIAGETDCGSCYNSCGVVTCDCRPG